MKRAFIFLCLCLPLQVFASDGVIEDLGRMQQALQNLNYYGTMVFMQGGDVQSMRLAHQRMADGEHERIVNLNGSPREVIRQGDRVVCYLPDSRSVTVSQRHNGNSWLSKLIANDFALLQDFYRFEREGKDRIAGFEAQIIRIRPTDGFRYGYRVWLDDDSALLLKSQLLSEDAKVLEEMMFADLSIVDRVPAEMLQASTDGKDFTWYEDDVAGFEEDADRSGWRIGHLPPGFRITSYTRHPLPDSEQLADHFVVSDGLASVSVYMERLGEGQHAFVGPYKRGAVNVFSASVAGHQVVVVGEVPAATVKLIATSVARVDDDD